VIRSLNALDAYARRPLIGYHVLDQAGWPIGSFCSLWVWAETQKVQFFGIRTSWGPARELLVPSDGVMIDQTMGSVQVPYFRDLVQDAPRHASGAELTLEQEREIYLHYDIRVSTLPSSALRH
jgi:hypothetical protein